MARVEGAGGALGKHIDGDGKRPETAAPRVLVGADGVEEKLKPVVLLDDEGEEIDLAAAKTRTAEAQKYMQKCRRKKTRGRQPMGGSTWVFAGPPRYDSEDAWSSAEVRSWAADCTKWVKKRSGKGSRIAHCALHQDEAAPHLHVTVIVADEQGRLGWNRIRKNFGVEGKTSGVLLMSGLQDNFHAAVGSKHGLDRGEVGSNREHAPVDRARGLKIRVEEEKNRTQQVTHQVKVEAGQAIAGVMERADVDAAKRYRERLDKAREDAAAAKSETVTARREAATAEKWAVTARRNAKAALEAAATAGERAGTAESRVGKLETSLAVLTVSATKVVGERDGLKLELEGVPEKIAELKQVLAGVPEKIADAVKQRDREWQPFLKEKVKAVVGERDGLKLELEGVPKKITDAVEQRNREWRPHLKKKVAEAVKAVVGERDGLKLELEGVPKKITDAVEQRDREWQPTLREAEQRATTAEGAVVAIDVVVEEMRNELEGVGKDRDRAQKDLKRVETERDDAKAGREQEGLNFDAMVGVVRELGVDRGDFDAAARRAGLNDDEAQFLRSKVGPGRGQER